ncbi:Tn3 family transposase [Nocardia gipuzkoensis]
MSRLETAADYGPLDKAARDRIGTTQIGSHWEDMCRIAVSMHAGEGTRSPDAVTRRQPHPFRAGDGPLRTDLQGAAHPAPGR